MLTNEEKKQLVERILNGNTFVKSPTSSVLLQYLVNATIDGIDVKETTIGVDLLGKNFDSDKGNARIRVNIYNLRKKLETYYEKEGKDDPWRIVINKGQYQTEFIQNTNQKTSVNVTRYWLWSLAAALFLSWGIFAVSQIIPNPVFWRSFFTNNKPTTLFIGDSFGVMGTTETGSTGWIRDYNINNLDDLYSFLENHPELKDKLSPANYYYTTGMAAYTSKEIAELFQQHRTDFSIRFTSNTNYSDIIEGNAIYAGPIKNNNKFIHFFNEENTRFKINDGKLFFSGNSQQPDTVFVLTMEGLEFEYAIVSRLEGTEQTAQFIFFSDHDIGVKATVEYFTNPDSLKAFSNRYFEGQDVPFTALFETWGIERTNTSLKPIIVSRIKNKP